MATYQQLLHSVALRANALIGSQAGPLETTYLVSPLTAANFKSADFPFTHFRDAILQGEQDFVTAVAFTGNHPWRRSILGETNVLTSGATLPTLDSLAKPIVGTYGSVFDGTDTTIPLVEMPLDVVVRRNRNAGTHYVCPVYYYKIDGNRIYHTRAVVSIECCTYSRTAQVTAFAADSTMLLPDPAEPGIVARALSLLFRDNAYATQAAVWRTYSDEALAFVRQGATSIVPKSVPMPVTEVRAA